MTKKQITQAKENLYSKYYGDNPLTPDNLKMPWSKEDEVEDEELCCREMINSILIYGGSCDKESHSYQEYLLPYVKGNMWHDGLISKKRLDQLIKEQQEDIAKAEIGFAGYDSEGVSYNYCKFADEY